MLKRNFNTTVQHDFEIKEADGSYRTATPEEIIETALTILNARFAKGTCLEKPEAVFDFLKLEMAHLEHEVFAVLWLDARHRVIAFEPLFRGTIDGTTVHPREVVKSALEHNASACILCHNHPSGSGDPSQADQQITNRIKSALDLIEVRTLDHVIVAENNFSFAKNGLL